MLETATTTTTTSPHHSSPPRIMKKRQSVLERIQTFERPQSASPKDATVFYVSPVLSKTLIGTLDDILDDEDVLRSLGDDEGDLSFAAEEEGEDKVKPLLLNQQQQQQQQQQRILVTDSDIHEHLRKHVHELQQALIQERTTTKNEQQEQDQFKVACLELKGIIQDKDAMIHGLQNGLDYVNSDLANTKASYESQILKLQDELEAKEQELQSSAKLLREQQEQEKTTLLAKEQEQEKQLESIQTLNAQLQAAEQSNILKDTIIADLEAKLLEASNSSSSSPKQSSKKKKKSSTTKTSKKAK